jgi:hypothetical protein
MYKLIGWYTTVKFINLFMEVKMKIKGFIKKLVLVSFALFFISSLGYTHTIDNVIISPEEPGPEDEITITVEGTFSDGCERVTNTLTTELDDEILFQIFTVPPECPDVITTTFEFEITDTIGPLGEGFFNFITIRLDGEVTLQDYDKTTIGEEPLEINIFITPRTINLKRQGNYIKCRITMPIGSDKSIDTTSLLLEETVSPVNVKEEENVIIAEFDNKELVDILELGDSVEITLTGEFTDGTPFTATDTVKVIKPGGGPKE